MPVLGIDPFNLAIQHFGKRVNQPTAPGFIVIKAGETVVVPHSSIYAGTSRSTLCCARCHLRGRRYIHFVNGLIQLCRTIRELLIVGWMNSFVRPSPRSTHANLLFRLLN